MFPGEICHSSMVAPPGRSTVTIWSINKSRLASSSPPSAIITMNSRKRVKPHPETLKKIDSLRLQIADARQHADVAAHDARTAKTALKKARKVYKLTKRRGKDARKKVKALKKLLLNIASKTAPVVVSVSRMEKSRKMSSAKSGRRSGRAEARSGPLDKSFARKLGGSGPSPVEAASSVPSPDPASILPSPEGGEGPPTSETPHFAL